MHIPKIVIPSYNRVDCLKEKTLNTLNRYNYPKDSIYIFVVDDEYEIYKSEFPEYNVIVGLKGLMNQRNFITDYFPENEELVCMDDDIEEICILDPEAKGGISALPDFTQFVLYAFSACKDNQRHIWGVYPIRNHFFMKQTISTDCKFLIGHLFGVINKKLYNTITFKDDYEKTLQYSKLDGGVCRFNYICCKTVMYKSGGLNLKKQERLQHNIESSQYLLKEFPEYVKLNPKKMGEILLRSPKAGV